LAEIKRSAAPRRAEKHLGAVKQGALLAEIKRSDAPRRAEKHLNAVKQGALLREIKTSPRTLSEGPGGKVVLLVTSAPSSHNQELNQRKMRVVFAGKGITLEEVDGSDPECRLRRAALFGLSGLHAVYPQCFIQMAGAAEPAFVGDWEVFEGLIECDSLDAEVLAANPDIPTFSNVFASLLNDSSNEIQRP
jgi:hypothetical protein